ncbi:hypothetical protein AEAC466_05860 [Asticcacaulis sp. AC466]|uniref:DUF4266 domain-containing protein n=1 Tax=Asticcacaulis sp. AC466 TaxID=1282362 RepID=UPI0003C3F65A|nr:DUF4266 domain-containing protein [Asticcacaulis sp. AC466]ESQ85235.1 hypothetical protein AEAC466_05860 [Asticcacaulis sp. AC466]
MKNRYHSTRRAVAAGAVFALLCLNGLTGCSSLGVKPWDRDLLATRGMALNTHPHITAADDHIYFSKEGSTGGRGFEGGGCGCN